MKLFNIIVFSLLFFCSFAQNLRNDFIPKKQDYNFKIQAVSADKNIIVVGNGAYKDLVENTLKIAKEILKEYQQEYFVEVNLPLRIIVYPSLKIFADESPVNFLESPFFYSEDANTIRVFFPGDYGNYYFLLRRAIADFYVSNLLLRSELWNKISYNQIPTWEKRGLVSFVSKLNYKERIFLNSSASKLKAHYLRWDVLPFPYYLLAYTPWELIHEKYGTKTQKDFMQIMTLSANFKTAVEVLLFKDYPHYIKFVKDWKNYYKKNHNKLLTPGFFNSSEVWKQESKNFIITSTATEKLIFTAELNKNKITINAYNYKKHKYKTLGSFKFDKIHNELLFFVKIPMIFAEDKLIIAPPNNKLYAYDIKKRQWKLLVNLKEYIFSVSSLNYDGTNLIVNVFSIKGKERFLLNINRPKLKRIRDEVKFPAELIKRPYYLSYLDTTITYFKDFKLGNLWHIKGKDSLLFSSESIYKKNYLIKAILINKDSVLALHYFPEVNSSQVLLHNISEKKSYFITTDSIGVLDFNIIRDTILYTSYRAGKLSLMKQPLLLSGLPVEKSIGFTKVPKLKTEYYKIKEDTTQAKKKQKKTIDYGFYVFDDEDTEEDSIYTNEQPKKQGKKRLKLKDKLQHYSKGAEYFNSGMEIHLAPLFRMNLSYHFTISDLLRRHNLYFKHVIFTKPRNQDVDINYLFAGMKLKPSAGIQFSQRIYKESYRFRFQKFSLPVGINYFKRNNIFNLTIAYNSFYRKDLIIFDYRDYNFSEKALSIKASWQYDNIREVSLVPVSGNYIKLNTNYLKQLGGNNNFLTAKLQLKKYIPLTTGLVYAGQLSGGISIGNAPQLFLLGGVQEWLNYEYQNPELLPVLAAPHTFMTMEYITPVRGFAYNSRNGTKYLLWNNELRFYFGNLFSPSLKHKGQNKFTLSIFYDIGTAWKEGNPFSQKNPVEKKYIDAYPFTIVVESYKSPFIYSFGMENHLMLSSFDFKFSLAWAYEDNQLSRVFLTLGFGKNF